VNRRCRTITRCLGVNVCSWIVHTTPSSSSDAALGRMATLSCTQKPASNRCQPSLQTDTSSSFLSGPRRKVSSSRLTDMRSGVDTNGLRPQLRERTAWIAHLCSKWDTASNRAQWRKRLGFTRVILACTLYTQTFRHRRHRRCLHPARQRHHRHHRRLLIRRPIRPGPRRRHPHSHRPRRRRRCSAQ
jgi:hypothetical protein